MPPVKASRPTGFRRISRLRRIRRSTSASRTGFITRYVCFCCELPYGIDVYLFGSLGSRGTVRLWRKSCNYHNDASGLVHPQREDKYSRQVSVILQTSTSPSTSYCLYHGMSRIFISNHVQSTPDAGRHPMDANNRLRVVLFGLMLLQ